MENIIFSNILDNSRRMMNSPFFKMRPKMKHEEKIFISCDVAEGKDLLVYQFWMRTPEGKLKLIKQSEFWRGCSGT